MSKRSPRLQFSDEERSSPELKKAIQKADKKADKLDKAEAKIPKKTVKRKERVVDYLKEIFYSIVCIDTSVSHGLIVAFLFLRKHILLRIKCFVLDIIGELIHNIRRIIRAVTWSPVIL